MNKENNRNAAGLRRSAVAERIRLREEWSALKEIDTATTSRHHVNTKKPANSRCTPCVTSKKKKKDNNAGSQNMNPPMPVTSDVLRGVVALVDVGGEARALPLRCALAALGATVVIEWSPLVTHLIWSDSGDRATRARARALGCGLVSPLWVEACAGAARRLRERSFPAAARQSDLPSPRTLRQLLKKAELENIPLVDLLSDSKEDETNGLPGLRISMETDTSTDRTNDSSKDTIDEQTRVNTAPRRGASPSRLQARSRRKLFTHKEAEFASDGDESDGAANPSKLQQSRLTQRTRRDLARAERAARRLLAAGGGGRGRAALATATQSLDKPKIVLTGMSRNERQAVAQAVQSLGGCIQNTVNKRTTHVLLGSCRSNISCSNHPTNITGVATHCDLSKSGCWSDATDKRARTANVLLGAARGCRVLHARWAVHCAAAGSWLHHNGYEVQHLNKISQKARVERSALGRQRSEYAYNVFNGMRVHLTPEADQRDAAIQLLTLCGAVIHNGAQNAREIQNGGATVGNAQNARDIQHGGVPVSGTQNARAIQHSDYDLVIGSRAGEVNSKWVFDSVAAARMRTTRRYINMNSFSDVNDSWRIR